MTSRFDIIWVSWETHRRSTNIVRALDIPLFVFSSNKPRLLKFPVFIFKTIQVIVRNRPRVLIIQSPSIFLNFLAVCLKWFFRFKLVVDAHNAGVYSCEPITDRIEWVYPFMQRRADLTLVTNEALAGIVRMNGGEPGILIDPIPDFGNRPACVDRDQIVTFVCTFAPDEPFLEVFKAAGILPPEVKVKVTGNVEANLHLIPENLPPNLGFTGFVPEEEYVGLLASSLVVIDLTIFDDCLVCGGYEAIALGTPLVVSDTPVNRETFGRGALFCNNSAESIAETVLQALQNNDHLRKESESRKIEMQILFRQQLDDLAKYF